MNTSDTSLPTQVGADGTHYRICPLCEACCGLNVTVEAGRVTRIVGAAQDVFSRGYLCPKGYALKELHEDTDRLRLPLIKRNGRHEAATWAEAFAEIEHRLLPIVEAHGRDAVALTVGNPAAHKMGLLLYFPRLARALGSKNVFSASTLDQMPKQLSCGWMFGHWLSVPVPDIERCDFLLVIGANPMASNGSLWTVPDFRGKAKAMRARGGRLVVIDPRRSETADVADAHHFIRPGSDVHLLAALVHTLLAEGLERPGRLAPWLSGLDALRAALAPFSPERAEAHCGMEAERIRALARELAAAERACVYGRIGTCTQRYGTVCSWLIDVINALTGNLDRLGGAMFPQAAAFASNTQGTPGRGRGIVTGRHASRVSSAPEVYGELPIALLAEEITTPGPGQVRALITVASNVALSSPGGPELSDALGQLEFMVSLDIYLNETSRHADVILPGLSPLEEAHYDVVFPQFSFRNHARYSGPVFPPPEGQEPEWKHLMRLAEMLARKGSGADASATKEAARVGPEQLVDQALRAGPYRGADGVSPLTLDEVKAAPGGIDLGPLQPRLPELLRTPSGLIELAPEACLADLASALNEALPNPAAEGEILLIGRREVRSNNSWMHNLPVLSKGRERCTLQIHPQDAERLGLQEGSLVELRQGDQTVQAAAEITDALMPGVASLPHGWGHDQGGARLAVAAARPGANLNALMDPARRDPLSGTSILSGQTVSVRAAM